MTLPATNAQLVQRGRTARSSSSASQTIQGHWGGDAYKVDTLGIFRHNGQGGSVRLRLWANSNYTGTVQDSGVLPLSTAFGSYDWGIPVTAPNDIHDLLLAEAPYWLYVPNFTAKSFTLDFTSCQRSYWDICQIFLGKYVEAAYNPQYGLQVTEQYGDIQTRTKSASLDTLGGGKWRDLKIDMHHLSETERQIWRSIVSKSQLSGNVMISVYPNDGTSKERDHVFSAQFQAPSPLTSAFFSETDATYTFTEV